MSRPSRSLAPFWLVLLAAFAAAPSGPSDEDENYRRLQAMPRERRVALSENLERFDKLEKDEQSSIRKLDAELSRLDPVEQARYRSLLRRYHLWANGLTDEQKARLEDAGSPEARFNLARKFRRMELEGGMTGPKVFGIRTGDYGLIAPQEAAFLLKTWNKLTPAQQVMIDTQRERGRHIAEIRAKSKTVGIIDQPLPPAERDRYHARLVADAGFKKQFPEYPKQFDASSKKNAASSKAEPDRSEQNFAEFLYFEENKPKSVSQRNLERFSATCPDWLHEMLDSLSPDDTRAYLTILYRLLYPEPTELPADAKPARPSTSSAPKFSKPAAKKSGPAGPF